MDKYVYLAWQDPTSRRWHIIGQLKHVREGYEFRYTSGIKNIKESSVLTNMPEHDKVYRSPELFSLFKNRVMPKSRPEYSNYLHWLALDSANKSSTDDLDTLAISGGEKETDFFRIIPVPEKKSSGLFSFKFLVHGVNYLDEHVKERINNLNKDDRLYLMDDFQNEKDRLALSLRTVEPICIVGYIPAYLTNVIREMRKIEGSVNSMTVNVVQVNKDAPVQMRLLCEFSSPDLEKPWEQYAPEFEVLAK
jgi:hypothetical protein